MLGEPEQSRPQSGAGPCECYLQKQFQSQKADRMSESETISHDAPVSRQPAWALGGVCLTLLAWLLFATLIPIYFIQPPNPVSADADSKLFSSERAVGFLEELVSDGIPHPAGSDQNDRVRDRIINMLNDFGYSVEIQKTENHLRQDPNREIVPLENIMARIRGKKPGRAVMLAAHYDSAPQGPGASDDGVGCACVLEIARMLKSEGPFENDLIIFISDGEELGLLGAAKFVEEHDWAREVECVINLEARGTSGPSFMFETSEHSRWLIPLFAKTTRRPLTSSLFYEVYKQLPNDTDFTMFKQGDMQGYNFAFISDVENYHTVDDNLNNVDMGTFQHHGENMLGLARELLNLDFDAQLKGQAVYFDVLGRWVFWWPASASIWIALTTFFAVASVGLISLRTHSAQPLTAKKSILSGLVSLFLFILVVVTIVGVGLIVELGLSIDGAFDNPRPEFPLPIQITFYSIAVTTVAAAGWAMIDRVNPLAMWTGTWLFWSIMATLAAWQVTGASYLFIVPTLIALVAGFALYLPTKYQTFGLWIGALGCGFFWLPLESLFFEALGFNLNVAMVIRTALVTSTLLPAFVGCSRAGMNAILFVGAAVALAATICSVTMVG